VKPSKQKYLYITLTLLLSFIFLFLSIQPSNNRNWTKDQTLLSYADVQETKTTIYNIRNFTYLNTSDYDIAYYNQTYFLSELDSLWFLVEPFSTSKSFAHTLLSFGFNTLNNSNKTHYLAISVEIRKEQGESFSAVKGLFKRYELMYVIGDENDLIKLRSNYRNDTVYLYKIKTEKETMQKVFLSMLERANELKEHPEFYNSLTNTCTTNIVSHVNHIKPDRVPFSFKVLLPAYSDKLAYDLGIIDTNRSFEDTREFYKINDRANRYPESYHFSQKIRA